MDDWLVGSHSLTIRAIAHREGKQKSAVPTDSAQLSEIPEKTLSRRRLSPFSLAALDGWLLILMAFLLCAKHLTPGPLLARAKATSEFA
jgi:hypothetical protein